MRVFIVGRVLSGGSPGRIPWIVRAVYTAEDPAAAACTGPDDFYAPIDLDVDPAEEPAPMDNAVFPIRVADAAAIAARPMSPPILSQP